MSFALKPGESPPAGALRALRTQVRDAGALTAPRKRISETQIHDARKALRRSRAVLRLLRASIGDRKYRRLNRELRDAARPLGAVRDASVLAGVFASLHEALDRCAADASLKELERTLRADRVSARRTLAARAQLAAIRRALAQTDAELGRQQLAADDWRSVCSGLERIYRHGRKACKVACREQSDTALHEWRKQTKYLRYCLQLLEPLRPGTLGELAAECHSLTDYLGDDHDLAVLRERIGRLQQTSPALDALLAMIDRRRRKLQDRALTLGPQLYGERPKDFLRRRLRIPW